MKFFMLAQTGHKLGIREIIKFIKQAGFTGVYLSGNEDIITDSDINYIYNNNLDIETYHLPYNVPFNLINALWENGVNAFEAKKILKAHVKFAKNHDIRTVILHASSGFNPPQITNEGLNNFKEVIDYGADFDIDVAIENIKRIEYVEALLANNQDDKIGFCFDIGHANAFTQNLFSYNWEPLIKRLKSVHIHDNNGKEDLHLIPGKGNIDFDFVFKEILPETKVNLTLETYYKDREAFYSGISAKQFFELAFLSTKDLEDKLRKWKRQTQEKKRPLILAN